MSEINHYKCDQCGKIETDLLYWWMNRGSLHFEEGELSFSVSGAVQHWCSSTCLKAWIDKKSEIIDGKFYKVKNV